MRTMAVSTQPELLLDGPVMVQGSVQRLALARDPRRLAI